ncbi:MAG TPA: outer membrane protein assembly factor BamD [Polyangia bacterium]|nr:outer membrane protein assembly factor BamD [Polyangia bacterium]
MSERATCPRFVEIGRQASPQNVPELRLHLEQCLYCQSQWSATKSLIESMRQLPVKTPEVARRQRTRNALVLAAAESQRRRFSPWWVKAAVYAVVVLCAAGVFAAVGTIALPWLQKQRVRAPAAAVRDQNGPRAATFIEPPAKIETVAEPKPGGQTTSRRSRGALALASRPTSALNSSHLPSPAELAFSEGWQAFRSGDYPGAIAGMRRALQAAPTSALAEDARYWEAVALARQGSLAQSRAVMEDFLRHFPASPRAGEVSAMLGWFLVASHEWAAAEQRFRTAESDRAPAVRESAKKGLEITARMRARPPSAP